MRRKIFSIWSVLLVLMVCLAVLVPGCGGGPTATQCTIDVKATLDGAAWTGAVQYTLSEAGFTVADMFFGTSVPTTHSNMDSGSWTCGHDSGGPAGASFVNITPSATQTVSAGGTITFTLNFVTAPAAALDHFKFYHVVGGPYVDVVLPKVGDQFYTGVQEVEVGSLTYFGNPVAKTHDGVLTPIGDPDNHLTLYEIFPPTVQYWAVEVDNQFGRQELTVYGPAMLAVPTLKEGHGPPSQLDHFLLYKVAEGPDLQVTVDLEDQWHKESDVEVYRPVYFANPAGKISPYVDWNPSDPLVIQNPDEHLVFYQIDGEPYQGNIVIQNQFHQQETLSVSNAELLAVPSDKISFEPVEPEPAVLDHFMCYWVGEGMVLPEWPGVVYLEDQLCAVEAEVGSPWGFYNPAEKWHDGVLTLISNPDHHLLAYGIYCGEEPQYWQVEVSNQFGVQSLIVYGPVALALPTQKIEPMYHEPPVGLDHFMMYEVIEGPPVNVVVGLKDQFGDQPEVEVGYPDYFFVPVRKTDRSGIVTEIQNPDEHLVSYEISGVLFYQQVQVVNQFGEHIFPNVEGPYCLTVPSEKLSAEPVPPQP